MSNITNPYESKIADLEAQIRDFRAQVKALCVLRDEFDDQLELVDPALMKWMAKIKPFQVNIDIEWGWSNKRGVFPRFRRQDKIAEHGLAIYSHWTSRRDPHDYGRSRLKINSYEKYMQEDFEAIPLTYASDNLDNLMPDDKILEKFVRWHVLRYNKKEGCYEHVTEFK